MLRQLALYYHKDANNLFMVRLAQVIKINQKEIVRFVVVVFLIYNNTRCIYHVKMASKETRISDCAMSSSSFSFHTFR